MPVRSAWLALGARFPQAAPKRAVSLGLADAHGQHVVLDDWIDRLRTDGEETAWLMQVSSKVLDREGRPRGDKLIGPWLRQLAAAAAGAPVAGHLVARDAVLTMAPLNPVEAAATLHDLAALWRTNLDRPLGVACKTALALLREGAHEGDARLVYDGSYEIAGEVTELCLARLWPDFAALLAAGDWPHVARDLYGPLADWIEAGVTVAPLNGGAE